MRVDQRIGPKLAITLLGVIGLTFGAYACTEEVPTPTLVPTVEPLTAEFSMTAETVMAPMLISLSVDEPKVGVAYHWDFGDGNSNTGPSVVHEYLDAGSFTVKLNAIRGEQSVINEAGVSVQPGAAGWVTLDTGFLSLESGQTHQFEFETFDELGNPVVDAAIEWVADPAVGSITQDGLFTAGPNVASAIEGVKAIFRRADVVAEAIVPARVVLGDIATIEVTPEVIDTRATWSIDLDAVARDSAGHEIEDAEITWEFLRPGDDIDQTGHFTPGPEISDEGAALLVVHANHEDVEIEQIVYGTIKPGILDRVEVSPDLRGLVSGAEVQLSALAFDRFENELELEKVEWLVADVDAGSITEDGMFTAGTKAGAFDRGTVTARGSLEGVESIGDVPLSILPAAAHSIEFKYPSDSVPAGAASPIELRVLDEHGNEIDDVDVSLEVLDGGSIQAGNVLKAGYPSGSYASAVVAQILPDAAGNVELIEATTDLNVRTRSSDFLAVDIVGPTGPEIYLINLATAELVPISAQIQQRGFRQTTPSWWPDGSRLAFALDVGGGYQLYDIDPFRDDIRQLTDIGGAAIMPAISPDGSRVAFIRALDWAWQVFTAEIPIGQDGNISRVITDGELFRVSTDDELRHLLPKWSPDGAWLMFTTVNREGETTTYIADPENPSGPYSLVVRRGAGLAWHPDGESILITADTEDSGSIRRNTPLVVDIASGEWKEFDSGGVGALVGEFSPDGSEIAFVDDNDGALWLTDSDGSGRRQALSAQFQSTITSWRPRPLQLPTPIGARLGPTTLKIPTGDVVNDRYESAEHGSVGPYKVILYTDLGEIHIDLYNHLSPVTVENFLNLVAADYYDGLEFHTVEEESAVFTGSVVNEFGGTAGYYIPSEYHPDARHDVAGTVSMLTVGENTGSSQFLITLAAKPEWDAYHDGNLRDCNSAETVCYPVFGRVIQGLELLQQFEEINRTSVDATPHRILAADVIELDSPE